MEKKHSLTESILLALVGVLGTIKKERNIKIHLIFALTAVASGLYFSISRFEWLIIIVVISIVLSAEVFNSAIEEICNLLREKMDLEYHETKIPRDVSAGAVLLLAMASLLIALIIFLPYIVSL